MRELSVDFGTSNTVAAVRTAPGLPPRLLSVDGWPVLPSAVWLAPNGELVVGRDAERQARLDPSRYEPNPKRRIDDVEVLLGDRVIPVVELIAAVLRRVADEARRQLGGEPDRVVLTHPADWRLIRCNTLRAAARAAGWSVPVQLLAEPVAAAAHFAENGAVVDPGQALVVYDLGGGTTDTAVVQRIGQNDWQVLAEAGLSDVGGTDFDQALAEHVRAVVDRDHPLWTEIRRPGTAAARRAARTLADDVRAGKEALSRYPQTDIPLPDPLPDAHVTRAELEALVRPGIERTVSMLSGTIASSGLDRSRFAGIYLVGGGTRMPLVAQVISERLGVLPVAVESPESTVVVGALSIPPMQDATDPQERYPHQLGHPGYQGHQPQPHALPPTHPQTPPAPAPAMSMSMPPPGQSTVSRHNRGKLIGIGMGVLGLGALAVVAVLMIVNGSRGNLPSDAAGSSTPSAPAPSSSPSSSSEVVPAGDKNAPFGSDAELRGFAGKAVDRAQSCKKYSSPAVDLVLRARTQVQCEYRVDGQSEPMTASFFATDSAGSCATFATSFAIAAQSGGQGQWTGGGRSGTWHDYTVAAVRASTTIYQDSGGKLCGVVESKEGAGVPADVVHRFWETQVKPGV
ncbi:Hsp70 family protein [Allokutzneria sp. A3M-2-11 16]|uniref:Hsp70 family protein n=1 Tax=Allokutzneria sp. A3M-2-11 16 TaxID=2962043 RepID=UPI0020B89D01|nr:Hsp70 family protein [Allokutzneria sp. A3M-2-11 16]MCP3799422.1 Hsp70 family protein [Allokutzneria sp. A3M-2-11 16]